MTLTAQKLIVDELKTDGIMRREYIASTFEALLEDPKLARIKIRNLINATCGFVELENKIGVKDKNLMRMFKENGNPTMNNLLEVLTYIIAYEKCTISVKVKAA